MKTWKTKLTADELNHLKVTAKVSNFNELILTLEGQAETRELFGDNPVDEPCWICRGIARKLGFPI